jgi:hypothetical protein
VSAVERDGAESDYRIAFGIFEQTNRSGAVMKAVLLIAALAVSTPAAYGQAASGDTAGQQECRLTLAQAPVIRGLRLGMTAEDVFEVFAGNRHDGQMNLELTKTTDRFGFSRLDVFISGPSFKPRFAGVNQVSFQFLDRRITSMWISYDGPEWTGVDEFISRVSEALNLPGLSAWKSAGEVKNPSIKTLKCNGFQVRVSSYGGGQNSINLQDMSADRVLNERKAEAREKARREFKP